MRISEALFRQVLDRSGQAIFVTRADTGKAVDVNQTALDWLGYTRDEFLTIGVQGVEVGYPIQSDEQWQLHMSEMRAIGRPQDFSNAQLQRKDGSIILVDVNVSLHTFEGVEYVLGVARNVTAEREAEDELRLTQLAVETAAEAMFRVGSDARILACNQTACDRLGYTKEELLEMRIFDLDPDYGPDVWPEHWEGIRQAKQLIIESNHRTKDGRIFPIEVSITYIPKGLTHDEHCCSFVRDISERRELQKRLRLADRVTTIGTLAAGVAHEINNPLQYVMLSFDLLRRSIGLDRQTREALEDAEEGCVRIRDIVANLQVLSRFDDGRTALVSVHSALEFAVKLAHSHFRHRARLHQELSDNEPFVVVHGGQLGQVLLNVIVNAGQAFTEERPDNQIRVRTSIVDDSVVVEVSDNGIGIPEQNLGRIFDAFYTTKPPGVGSGLGLSIAQSIIAGVGGTLDVRSRVGFGTTVTISLPRAEAPAASSADQATTALARALIVDDDPAVARAFKRSLGDFFIETALDGTEALRLLRELDFDVVLCDVMMPGISGPELYAMACESDARWKDRFVFITGGACTDAAKRFIDETTCECLVKPVTPEDLRRRLARFSQS